MKLVYIVIDIFCSLLEIYITAVGFSLRLCLIITNQILLSFFYFFITLIYECQTEFVNVISKPLA